MINTAATANTADCFTMASPPVGIYALQFLMTREITHEGVRRGAGEHGQPRFSIGKIAPTAGLVDQFFNDSTGLGDHGEIDARGPWNEGHQWEFVEAPAFHKVRETVTESPSIHAESS